MLCYIWKCGMSEPMLWTKICLVSELLLQIKCVISEHMLHTNIRCVLSEVMLHTKMWYVRIYVTNENIMFLFDLLLHTKMCNVWTYVYTRMWNVFCPVLWYMRNILCPNLLYTRKYDVFLSKMMLHMTMLYLRTYVTHEHIMSFVRTYVTYENV